MYLLNLQSSDEVICVSAMCFASVHAKHTMSMVQVIYQTDSYDVEKYIGLEYFNVYNYWCCGTVSFDTRCNGLYDQWIINYQYQLHRLVHVCIFTNVASTTLWCLTLP